VGLKVATFVDEYDSSALHELAHESGPADTRDARWSASINFFQYFYTTLKASTFVSHLFITGSSRLPLTGFWSGSNAIADLTLEPELADVLGIAWPETEAQAALRLLKMLHGLSREQLRDRLTAWCSRHRWSPDSSVVVFNPWCVTRVLETGTFDARWTLSGTPTLLGNSALLSAQLLRVAAGGAATVTIHAICIPKLLEGAPRGRAAARNARQLGRACDRAGL